MSKLKIRGFEFISENQFKKDIPNGKYEDLHLPVRKTKHSVGYDFEAAETKIVPSIWKSVIVNIGKFFTGSNNYENIKPTLIKTGIKSYFQPDEALILANRSSNPIKKGLVLSNSIGIIESDYYNNPDNEGHMMFGFYNFFPFDVEIKQGESIGQGFFINYLKADNDNAERERVGGFGSTDNQTNPS